MKTILSIAFIYLSLIGLVTFSMFIMQEAQQTTQWALRISEPDLYMKGQQLNETLFKRMRFLNHIAWINPYAHFAYRSYIENRGPHTKSVNVNTSTDTTGPLCSIKQKRSQTFDVLLN